MKASRISLQLYRVDIICIPGVESCDQSKLWGHYSVYQHLIEARSVNKVIVVIRGKEQCAAK